MSTVFDLVQTGYHIDENCQKRKRLVYHTRDVYELARKPQDSFPTFERL